MAHIVVDCDTGVDDALALTVALRWQGVKVEAITCVAGNTGLENVIRNTLSVVKVNNRTVPIYPGCRHSLLRRKHTSWNSGAEATHASNGFGGVEIDLDTADWQMVQSEHAAVALCRLAKEHKKKLSVVALAPLTNIALAMRLDTEFTHNLKEIFVMGGNYTGPGSEIGGAEFNFYIDAEAADVVLREACCPITIVPFDTCERSSPIPWEWFNKIVAKPSLPAHARLIGDIMSHFNASWHCFDPCDAVAMIAALDKGSISSADIHRFLAVNIHADPHSGDGYGCLMYKASDEDNNDDDATSGWNNKLLFESVPPRTIASLISTDEIKRRIEDTLV